MRISRLSLVLILIPGFSASIVQAIARPVSRTASNVPVLMVSDIHFDPMHDPAKFKALLAAPESQWSAILIAPAAPDQPNTPASLTFDNLQSQCGARGVDTPYPLLQSSLKAMQADQPHPLFITLTGDIIAHAFDCRFRALAPQSTAADYEAFVLKTIGFVLHQLRDTFPDVPIYAALGNNDSSCGDYKLTPGNTFLAETGKLFAASFPLSQQPGIAQQFAAGGYYSVSLPAPLSRARILILNDVFESTKYTTCAGTPSQAPADDEMTWLNRQLAQAQQAGESVWIIGHIPPGVDPYSTIRKSPNLCSQGKPTPFLSSDNMYATLIQYAPVIRLALFAHTHMDELRLLQPEAGDPSPNLHSSVPLKMVPSISPVDGNDPAFTVAQVDPATAVLKDYTVVAASNQSGIGTTWSPEYDYASAFGHSSFDAASLKAIIAAFQADSSAHQPASEAYLSHYFIGGNEAGLLRPFWPQYVCALANTTARAYAGCVCSSGK